MSSIHPFTLEPYKGRRTRHTCPGCGKHHEFTRYIDTENQEYLADYVGKCNRENKCNYHYTPGQFFRDNPNAGQGREESWRASEAWKTVYRPPVPKEEPVQYLPWEVLQKTLKHYEANNFVRFLASLFGEGKAQELALKYKLGTSNKYQNDAGKAVVFWQIDKAGRIHQAKVMAYHPKTGRRLKAPGKHFVSFMGKAILRNRDANLQQCLFGEHLLAESPELPIALVESEKTAVLMAGFLPDTLWLATGGKHGARWTDSAVYQALANRDVVLYPDLGACDSWQEKAKMLITVCRSYEVSDMLEQVAEEGDREAGYDIADYFIHMHQAKESESPVSAISTEEKVDPLPEPAIENPSDPKPPEEQRPNEDAQFWKNFHQYQQQQQEALPPGWRYQTFANGHTVLLDADDLPATWNLNPKSELEKQLIERENQKVGIPTDPNPAVGELMDRFGLEVLSVEPWNPETENEATETDIPEEKSVAKIPIKQASFFDGQSVDREALERMIAVQTKAVERAKFGRKEREKRCWKSSRRRRVPEIQKTKPNNQAMKKILTQIRAIDVESKELRTFCGPDVWARDIEAARALLDATGFGYCLIVGVAVDSPVKPEAFILNCLN